MRSGRSRPSAAAMDGSGPPGGEVVAEMVTTDAANTKMVRSEIGRRYVDSSLLDIRVSHGTVHLGGVIGPLRLHRELDMAKEMAHISTILRSKPGIREVVWEVTIRG